ncbi:MAG: hypothetical protein M3094_06790, partial [Actinomycetia bacterium]|nr:hypothetical protein [Actinomycetes bacterium]
MIRRTITTLTLAAVTTIAIATAAPALGAPPAADLSPSIDVPLIDPCVFPCLNIDWDLGGLLDPAPGSDDPADPGIVVDVPGIVVDPEILIVDVPLDPIIDLTPSAEGSDATDPAPTVEEDIERLAPIGPDELRELVGEATPLAPLAGTETAPSPEAGTSSTS